MMGAVCPNQKLEICVSTMPFSGIGVGRTTSKAESRSVTTMSSRSGAYSYTSRTLPRLMSPQAVSPDSYRVVMRDVLLSRR